MRVIYCFAVFGLQLSLSSELFAGPPLTIDDPGILEPGEWELIVAGAIEQRESGRTVQSPIFDISVGLSSNTQIAVFVPWQSESLEGFSNQTGIGYLAVGYKWRFHSTSTTEWAFAPSYALPVSKSLPSQTGSADVNVFSFPLLVSRLIGEWTLFAQFAWNMDSEGNEDWSYGLAASRPLGNSCEWMVEISGDANRELNKHSLNYLLGIDYAIREELHVLASVGRRISSGLQPDDEIEYNLYFGMQWFFH